MQKLSYQASHTQQVEQLIEHAREHLEAVSFLRQHLPDYIRLKRVSVKAMATALNQKYTTFMYQVEKGTLTDDLLIMVCNYLKENIKN